MDLVGADPVEGQVREGSSQIGGQEERSSDEKMNMDYYLQQEGYVETVDRVTMYLDWCKKGGIIMPKSEYPGHFGDGLVGLRCVEDIQHREAYLYVPYKMMITISKVLKDPVLAPIIESNPDLFHFDDAGENIHFDRQHQVLVLGLLYEITKGKDSKWYPFLRQFPDNELKLWESDADLDLI